MDRLPNPPPLMKCGHAANSLRTLPDAVCAALGVPSGSKIPACVICSGTGVGADSYTVDRTPPSLDGRVSRCSYYRPGRRCACGKDHCPPTRHGAHGGNYPSVAPSSVSLPFFEHRPDEPFDRHFCGCWGWD